MVNFQLLLTDSIFAEHQKVENMCGRIIQLSRYY